MIFNLKKHGHQEFFITERDLLRSELEQFCILKNSDGYQADVGDEIVQGTNLNEIKEFIQQGINELTAHIWQSWKTIADLSQDISSNTGENSGGLDNLIFLNSVKKALLLSRVFNDLDFVTESVFHVLDTDIKNINEDLVQKFNSEYLKIKSIHAVIMSEIYRTKLISKFMSVIKMAQTSGPWSNLDLPMSERAWSWDDQEEEYFSNRQDSRRQQTRYNPENATKSGFYYVWQDFSTEPYKFTDLKSNSPYKSRHSLLQP